ncbi:hypothetical protein GCM10027029_17690 [Conyzicola lurida]
MNQPLKSMPLPNETPRALDVLSNAAQLAAVAYALHTLGTNRSVSESSRPERPRDETPVLPFEHLHLLDRALDD